MGLLHQRIYEINDVQITKFSIVVEQGSKDLGVGLISSPRRERGSIFAADGASVFQPPSFGPTLRQTTSAHLSYFCVVLESLE